jgi:hypothetical protein
MSKMRKDPLLCMFADRTGIYQNNVSLLNAFGQAKPRPFKRGTDQRRVQFVHLTSEGFNVYSFAIHTE